MKNFVTSLLLSLTLLVFSFSFVLAQTPTPPPDMISEINSFDAFWPMVAGKTMEDNIYFLKRAKENVRGLLIFGLSQKADYKVFLATKRILEAEKLIKEGKNDSAKKTLDAVLSELSESANNIDSAKSSKASMGEVYPTMSLRVVNIEKLAKWLSTTNSELKDKLLEVANKSKEIQSKF